MSYLRSVEAITYFLGIGGDGIVRHFCYIVYKHSYQWLREIHLHIYRFHGGNHGLRICLPHVGSFPCNFSIYPVSWQGLCTGLARYSAFSRRVPRGIVHTYRSTGVSTLALLYLQVLVYRK